jgi:tRNA-modifying protein YgfZ
MTAPLLVERTRGLVRVAGREPVRMIQGLATADIAAVGADRGVYTTFLTAKGKMVADARVFLAPGSEDAGLLIGADPRAAAALLTHIARFVPPLFARAEDVSAEWSVLGIYGPGASDALSSGALSVGAEAEALEESVVSVRTAPEGFAARTRLVGDDGWDVFVPADQRAATEAALLAAGARPGSPDALEALRVAAGHPRWGQELTEDVIPLEAGLLDRAISQSKGCYTGQEVIVRILHRGHVNRHLRRLIFEADAPAAGTELYEPGVDRPRGLVTSAVANEAGALGLGYVRREVEPPADLHVGAPDGPLVRIEALD